MRGTFFQSPLEYQIEISGESWKQGDQILGTCILKNHSSDLIDLKDYQILLAFTDYKKIKSKDDKALQPIFEQKFSSDSLAGNATLEMAIKIELPIDAPITENTKGIYLICGPKENTFQGALLEFPIAPAKAISDFLELFKRFHRFELKGLKNKKDLIEAKMLPPATKELGAVEQLLLSIQPAIDQIHLKYTFKVRKLSYENANVTAKSDKVVINQDIPRSQLFSFGGDTLDQDFVRSKIGETLESISRKTTY